MYIVTPSVAIYVLKSTTAKAAYVDMSVKINTRNAFTSSSWDNAAIKQSVHVTLRS